MIIELNKERIKAAGTEFPEAGEPWAWGGREYDVEEVDVNDYGKVRVIAR